MEFKVEVEVWISVLLRIDGGYDTQGGSGDKVENPGLV